MGKIRADCKNTNYTFVFYPIIFPLDYTFLFATKGWPDGPGWIFYSPSVLPDEGPVYLDGLDHYLLMTQPTIPQFTYKIRAGPSWTEALIVGFMGVIIKNRLQRRTVVGFKPT